MSKKLTLKGLALGAVLALGISAFAGAPAQAAPTSSAKIVTSANKGTSLNTLQGASFALKTNLDPTLKTIDGKDLSKLTYLITNSSGAALNFTSIGAVSTNGYYHILSADTADNISQDGAYDRQSATAGATVVTQLPSGSWAKQKAVVINNGSQDTTDSLDLGSNVLTITSSTDAKDAYAVTVQAFIDGNKDGKISDFEYVGEAVTINFLPTATATATTTVTSAVLGSRTLKATTVVDGVNNQNLAGQLLIGFTRNGVAEKVSANTNATGSVDTADTTYDTGLAALKNTQTNAVYGGTGASLDSADSIDGSVYAAQAYLGLVKIGSVSNATSTTGVKNASVDSTDQVKVANNTSVTWTAGATVTGNQANTSTAAVKTGYNGDIKFSAKLISRDATEVALSGVTVKVTLNKTTLATGSTFTAGGATLSATSGDVSFLVTSDADGYIAFTGKGTGALGDVVVVKIAALLSTGAYDAAGNDQATLTWADSALATPVVTNTVDSNNVRIAAGSTYTLNFSVTDQFGAAPASGSYRYAVSVSGNTGAAFAYYPVVTGSTASQAIVDNSTAAGTYTVAAQLQKIVGGVWTTSGSVVNTDVYVSSKAASAVSATVPTVSVATIAKTLVAADLRVNNNAQTATSIGYSGTAATVAGTVTDSLGAAVPGQTVTIAGAGLGFINKDGNVYAIGSITVNTDDNGGYQVSVFSTASGKQSITVTAGAATATKTITFTGITSLAETNVLSLDVASLSQVGRAVTVTVKLVDKYGNVVTTAADKVAIAVTGVGSLSAKTLTIDKGTATAQFVAGANDFGDAVITAKYTATDAAETVVSATKTITVGVTDAQVDVVNNRVTAVASFSKGKTVGFYVDGVKKWSKLSASDADVVLNYNLKKGTHTVTVKISGGFITTETIVVK
jgi:hypothetical protein